MPYPRSSAASSGAGARILLAEDNEINQQVATELLQQAGFFVDVANGGAFFSFGFTLFVKKLRITFKRCGVISIRS